MNAVRRLALLARHQGLLAHHQHLLGSRAARVERNRGLRRQADLGRMDAIVEPAEGLQRQPDGLRVGQPRLQVRRFQRPRQQCPGNHRGGVRSGIRVDLRSRDEIPLRWRPLPGQCHGVPQQLRGFPGTRVGSAESGFAHADIFVSGIECGGNGDRRRGAGRRGDTGRGHPVERPDRLDGCPLRALRRPAHHRSAQSRLQPHVARTSAVLPGMDRAPGPAAHLR